MFAKIKFHQYDKFSVSKHHVLVIQYLNNLKNRKSFPKRIKRAFLTFKEVLDENCIKAKKR